MAANSLTPSAPFLYHHTDSARLPWILRDQSLKPGSNNIGDFPDDFLWATPDPMGDPTASSAVNKNQYRDGDIAAVRFTLSRDDFKPWDDMKTSHPRWQARHIALLESAAIKMGATPQQIAQWRCRLEPLPASEWLAVEFRTWRNPRWRAVQANTLRSVGDGGASGMGVQLDDVVFCSQQRAGSVGMPTAYACSKLELSQCP
jgi:hypothetical protein